MIYIVERITENGIYCEFAAGQRALFRPQELPEGVREGDVLVLTNGVFSIDPELTRQRKEQMQKKLRDLTGL